MVVDDALESLLDCTTRTAREDLGVLDAQTSPNAHDSGTPNEGRATQGKRRTCAH